MIGFGWYSMSTAVEVRVADMLDTRWLTSTLQRVHARIALSVAAALATCLAPGATPSVAAEKPVMTASASNPLLTTLSWDLGPTAAEWRHKDNAQLAAVPEDDKSVLRLTSRFEPYTFTWMTRQFRPHLTDGIVHVGFRVRGDGSGHLLQVYLGARRPDTPRPLYYANRKQAITLDFRGWREVTVELDQFATPAGGLRDQDLAHVVFLQFMISAKGKEPLDLGVADIRFFGHTPQELAAMEKQRQERQRIVAEVTAGLVSIRQDLARLHQQIDAQAKQGKFVDVARVYAAALAWSADDIQRCLEAEEFEIVRQARSLLDSLKERLADPQQVLKHVQVQVPPEDDPYRVGENPYFGSVIKVAQSMARKEAAATPKGRRGYLAVPNAWSFAGFGNRLFDKVWSMTTPQSPLRHHPVLLANTLSQLDTIAHQHTDGDFNIDRTAIYGRDPNINRFCLAPTLDAWWRLRQEYPDLLPAAKQAELEAGLKQLADYQLTDYGLARLERQSHVKFPAYPNMDVHHILIMEFADRLWGDPQYAKERAAFVKLLDSAVYPMGGFAYINTQNECFVYHHLNVVYSARFWKLTGTPATLAMLKRTIPFYPYNVEPAGMPEYYTDACWKHYWGGGGAAGPDVIAGLFDDRENKRVADVCGAIWGYGHGYMSAIAAEFWEPLASAPLPDGYTIHDTNIDGPRGRYGTWSFAGNGRDYGVGYQGKDTFVGAMLTDPPRRPLPLDSALQVVTSEVRLNHTDNHWTGGRCCSALERLTTTLGPDFGSLAVRYTVSKPNWHHKNDDLIPWDGIQTWYLSRTRLVGLVALEATADETRAAVHGRIRLGLSRTIEPAGPQAWKYGRLRVKVHDHSYAQVTTKPSETFYLDKPEKYRSTEITLLDPLSVRAGQKGNVTFPRGTRYWFLVEVYPDSSPAAVEVKRLQDDPVVGFCLRESERWVGILHNPTDSAATASWPLPTDVGQAQQYDDVTGKGQPCARTAKISLSPQKHVVIVGRQQSPAANQPTKGPAGQ